MAHTKRKRRSKHRGTAAGTIEARGRTSRPASASERKKLTREQAREKRLNTPPSWKSSFYRAGFAAVLLFVFIALESKKNGVAEGLFVAIVALLLYVPAGYYLELFLFRRRQRRKQPGK